MSATCVSQSGSPVRASSATSAASSVPTNTRCPSTATPRLNGLISYGLRTFCGRVVSPDLPAGSRVERDDGARLPSCTSRRRRRAAWLSQHRVARHWKRPRGLKLPDVRRRDLLRARNSACPDSRPSTSASCAARASAFTQPLVRDAAGRHRRGAVLPRSRAPSTCRDRRAGSAISPAGQPRRVVAPASATRSRRAPRRAAACRADEAARRVHHLDENVSSLRRTPRISRPSSRPGDDDLRLRAAAPPPPQHVAAPSAAGIGLPGSRIFWRSADGVARPAAERSGPDDAAATVDLVAARTAAATVEERSRRRPGSRRRRRRSGCRRSAAGVKPERLRMYETSCQTWSSSAR